MACLLTPAHLTFALPSPALLVPGAKLVVRVGSEKWPCLSLHAPPSLQALEVFTGPEALERLTAALAEHEAEAAQAGADGGSGAGGAEPAAAAGAEEQGPLATATAAAPAAIATASRAGEAGPTAAPVGGLTLLEHGAGQLKELLQGSKASGSPLVLAWVRGGDATSEALREAAAAAAAGLAAAAGTGIGSHAPRLVLADASPGHGKANERLAAALGVSAFPCLQLYSHMRAERRVAGPGEATPAALRALLGLPEAVAMEAEAAAAAAPEPATEPAVADAAAGGASSEAAAAEGGEEAAAAAEEDPYAPPSGKFARKNAIKRMPSGAMGQ